MWQYPKEVSLMNEKSVTRRTQKLKEYQKGRRSLYQPVCREQDGDTSFTDLPRQMFGVDIRQTGGSEAFKLATCAGQLRAAYSQVEGLDVYSNKESQNEISREMERSKDNVTTSDKLTNGQNNSNPPSRLDNSRDGLSTFEQTKIKFMKKHQFKAEIKSGKRVGFYRFILDIGRGNFAKVKLASHSLLNTSVAVKVIDRTKFNAKTRKLLAQEVTNMERLNHPHIIQIFEVHDIGQRCYLMMEYAPAGELHSYLRRNGRMENRSAKHISAQIVSAIKHMHENRVIHRDLKAENILFFTPNFVKVGDFGFSRLAAPEDPLTTFCGSPSYAAPELFVGKSYIGPAVDLWALGVLIFYMVCGVLPFRGDSLQTIKQSVLGGNYMIPAFVKPECKQLIDGLLCKSIKRRLRIEQVQRNGWYSDQNWLDHSRASHPNPNQADAGVVRSLLDKWWGVEEWELNEALADGPENPLTGIYRILLAYGKKFEGGREPVLYEKKKAKKKPKDEGSINGDTSKRKGKKTVLPTVELTTVDLRDEKLSVPTSNNSFQKHPKVCTIS